MELHERQTGGNEIPPTPGTTIYEAITRTNGPGNIITATTKTIVISNGSSSTVVAAIGSNIPVTSAGSSIPIVVAPSNVTSSISTITASTPTVVCPVASNLGATYCSYNPASSPIPLVQTTILSSTTVAGGSASQVVVIEYVPLSSTTSETSSVASSTNSGSSTGVNQSTSSSAAHNSTFSQKNNTGLLAGVAVAGIVAGALIVGLIAFCLFKKRARKDRYVSRNTYVPAASPTYGGEKGTPMVSITPVLAMDFLPQQADDAEVKHKLSTVIDQIDQHVENFYGNRNVPMDANEEAEISRFETSELPLPLAACFQNSAAPMTLIKHCLAYHIFNLTMSPGEHGTPLLPSEIAGVITAMYHKSLSPAATKDTMTAFSTWKSLTKYLRPDLGRDPSTAKAISDNSARISNHFTDVFSPWANPQYNDDTRARHLTELIIQTVHTAIWLFGQPDNYRFEWDVPNTRQNTNYSAVIVPAIWKTTHSGSRLNGKGQNVLSPVIKGF